MSTDIEHEMRIRFVGDCGPLFAAMAKAQNEYGEVHRDKTVIVEKKAGGSYKFNYAPLENILDATLPALNKYEVCFMQPLAGKTLYTILGHSSGCRMEAEVDLLGSDDIKTFGGEITYLRRYCGQAVLAIAAEQDDDGNMASGDQREVHDRKPNPACPNCGNNKAVIADKYAENGGWFCYGVKGGCGKKWSDEASQREPDEMTKAFNKARADINLATTDAECDAIAKQVEPLLDDQKNGQVRSFVKARKAVIAPMPTEKKKRTPNQLKNDMVGKVALIGTETELDVQAEWLKSKAESFGLTCDMILECNTAVENQRRKIQNANPEPVNA